MKKKLSIFIAMLAVIALAAALLAGCGSGSGDDEASGPESIVVTDLAGREVEIAEWQYDPDPDEAGRFQPGFHGIPFKVGVGVRGNNNSTV